MLYQVSYQYMNQHGAGPFDGQTIISDVKYTKGDIIWALMGKAIVVSCRAIKT